MLLPDLPEEVAATGLAYRNTITPRTIVLLAQAHEHDVMIFVDRADADIEQSLPAQSERELFRRQLDELVLYELTPLDQPHLLKHFFRLP